MILATPPQGLIGVWWHLQKFPKDEGLGAG